MYSVLVRHLLPNFAIARVSIVMLTRLDYLSPALHKALSIQYIALREVWKDVKCADSR